MDKNFFFAFFLSTLVILGYYWMYPPSPSVPEDNAAIEQTTEENKDKSTVQDSNGVAMDLPEPLAPIALSATRKKVEIDTSVFKAEIDSQDGILRELSLKNYKYALEQHKSLKDIVVDFFTGDKTPVPDIDPNRLINMTGDLSTKNKIWNITTDLDPKSVNYHVSTENLIVNDQPGTLTLQAQLENGLEITKKLTFYPDSYEIDFDLIIINRSNGNQRIFPRLNFGAANEIIGFQPRQTPKKAFIFANDEFEIYDDEEDYQNVLNAKSNTFAGIMDTYFLTAVKMADPKQTFDGELSPLDSKIKDQKVVIPKLEFAESKVDLLPNQTYMKQFKIYMGPKHFDLIENFHLEMPKTMDIWLDALAQPLLITLRWFQKYVVNWGVAIILLTIVVRLAMLPLAYKGIMSMAKMSDLNPQMKAIREKYKDKKERMNKEIMQLYKQNKVNPVGGCLPMVLQIPIFIALYQALLPAIELRHSPFIFWLNDLSAPDFTLILPLLMGISMFLQQSLTPTPTMDPTQAKMMKWMPVMFIFFFLDMPAGLVLYWVVSNIISIFQQMLFNKIKSKKGIGNVAAAAAPVKPISKKKKK
jgi:YidC/Oxa1 family membrane protein insertase